MRNSYDFSEGVQGKYAGRVKKPKVTRRTLVHDLMSKGFTRRESERLLSSIFSAMVTSLKSHEAVELPFGTLEVKKNPAPVRFFTHGTIAERFRRPYRVVLKPRG